MLDRETARRLCEQVLDRSAADACEVALGGGEDALTRFANNEIHQSMASSCVELSVRSVFGKRTGRASTTRLDDAGVRAVVQASEQVARLMPELEDLPELPSEQRIAAVPGAYDAETARLDAAQRAERARCIIDQARRAGFNAAGMVRCVDGEVGEYGEKGTVCLANSKGLFAWHETSSLQVTTTVQASDSSGWADVLAHAARDVDAAAIGHRATEKARLSAAPRSVAPGEYTVILEAAAVAELVAFLAPEFSATVVDEGRSFLSNRQGQQLFGAGIRLSSDPFHPLHQGRPFDEIGDPTRPVVLVEDGRHRGLVYDRAAARRHGVEPTGHALRVPSTEGAVAGHLVLDGGERSVQEMIADTRRGILVSRVWYTRTVDPATLLITGMTRDGTFWIEDGAVRHGIRNLRFNQSVPELLRHVVAAGKPEYAWPAVVPPLKVEGFRFTSETSF
jgi:predicted Zn-dependent protease